MKRRPSKDYAITIFKNIFLMAGTESKQKLAHTKQIVNKMFEIHYKTIFNKITLRLKVMSS